MVAPADQVVNEDITAPDWDVIHSWWVPGLRRQVRRDPGHGEQDVVQGAGRDVRRALLRALRDPARGDEGEGRRRAAVAVRRVHRASARRAARDARPRPEECDRRLPEAATGSTTSTSARRSAATRCSPTARASRRCCGTARDRCRRSAATGARSRSTRSSRTRSGSRRRRRLVAVNVETISPYRADWRAARVSSWLTTVDHKRIGILYIWHVRSSSSRSAACSRC